MLKKEISNELFAVVAGSGGGGGGGSSSGSGSGGGTVYCTWDCSARKAAKEAYDAATIARQNAETLRSSLQTEKENVESLFGGYTGMYNALMGCGSSVANPANMGVDSGMGSIIDCLSKYGSAVSDAYDAADAEVERCLTVEAEAKKTWQDTKCVKVCS